MTESRALPGTIRQKRVIHGKQQGHARACPLLFIGEPSRQFMRWQWQPGAWEPRLAWTDSEPVVVQSLPAPPKPLVIEVLAGGARSQVVINRVPNHDPETAQ